MPPARAARPILFAAAVLLCAPAPAADETACPAPLPALQPRAPAPGAPAAPAQIYAREVRSVAGGVSEFIGDVELERGGDRLTADRLRYDKAADQADATGDIRLGNAAGDSLATSELHLQLESHTGYAGPSSYTLAHGLVRGDAERIELAGPDLMRLRRARFTTCPPGQDSWFLRMSELELDTADDLGTAYHTTVAFQGVPIFYLPYLSFSISDRRKSGFLFPRLGTSENLGTEIAVPYYWNIAPNYDATITPRILSKRGVQLQNEFRYLGRRHEGRLDFDILENDKVGGEDRAAGAFKHQHALGRYWSAGADIRGVSDKNYLSDFGDRLAITSQTHMPQNADIQYRGPQWNFAARLADYQTVDSTIPEADRPYARLPQLTLATTPPSGSSGPRYHLDSEWTRFHRGQRLNGERLNLNPALSLPLTRSYGFFTPRLGARYIGYDLAGDTAGVADTSPELTRGVYSLDTGLFFDRDSAWGGREYTHTLEPRLFYLYVPYKGQDDLPNFDTGAADFSFTNLFRDNRFSGGDRVGDANQITAALTTRLLDGQDGVERLRLSLGRIHYFADRKVNLPPGTIGSDTSDTVAEAAAWLVGNWHARASVQWGRGTDETQKSNIYLQYNPERNKILNLGQRHIRGELRQTDVSAEWPVSGRWALRARSIYSQHDNRNLETYAGLEYNACCWALRLVATRRYISTTNDQVNAAMFELELTGLSKRGTVPESPLTQSLFSFPASTRAAGDTPAP